ncbi:MAG: alpha/beta fold hydrolase [Vibrionaceae bacterium]
MPTSRPFCKEADLASNQTLFRQFWATRKQGQFVATDGLRLQWCAFEKSTHTKAIVIVNGRTETQLKYVELFYDLFSQGFDIYSYDHRGQGLSQRLISGCDAGHVVFFDDYVDDLEAFFKTVVSQKQHQTRLLLGHSMGGAVSCLYAARNPATIHKVVLVAPMLDIALPKWQRPFAEPLTWALAQCQHPPTYLLGQSSFAQKSTDITLLTHSQARHAHSKRLYIDKPSLQVGGPTARWVWQSLQAAPRLQKAAQTIPLPMLFLQGAQEQIICNEAIRQAHRQRTKQALPSQLFCLDNARHELLFEQDSVRDQVLDHILDFA